MRPTRRGFLAIGTGALPALMMARRARATGGQRNLVLCLTGIGPETPPEVLDQVAELFLSRAIPVCCALDLSRGISAPIFGAAAALARREPGLVELMVEAGPVEAQERYFQMRAAGALRDRVRELLDVTGSAAVAVPVVTVFAEGAAEGRDLAAFRSAGFLGHVALDPKRDSTLIARLGQEQVELSGGIALDPARGGDPAALRTVLRRRDDVLIGLRLPEAGGAGLAPGFADLADQLRDELDVGTLFATRPMDLAQLLSGQAPASLAILLAPPASADPADPVRAMMVELTREGVPFTVVDAGGAGGALPSGTETCAVAGAASSGDCVLTPDASGLEDTEAHVIAVVETGAGGWSEVDAGARLRIAAARGAAEWGIAPEAPPSAADRLILISAADVATQVARIALAQRLAGLRASGEAKLFSVAGFADHVMAPDTVLARFQSARRRGVTDPPATAPVAEAERTALMEDARIAWRYIERLSHATTGLAAGAAQMTAAGSVIASRQATLWDLASQIQGIVGARALGLTNMVDATGRIARMLEHLPEQRIENLRLPPLFVATDRKAVVTRGYDFCDTGRFLIALSSAVKAGLLAPDRAKAVFEGWDLAGTIRDGRPFEYGRRGWSDVFYNHCTPVLSRALAGWGLTFGSPYPEAPPGGGNSPDFRMRLLYAAAFIGPYGAEPPLLEESELGPSPATRCLGQVLFDAQLGHFERTGQLKCVSETSLNAAPWFSYQGFRIDAAPDAGWVITSPNPDPRYATDAFRAEVEAVSAKAAYLWAAHYPHAYSQRLVDYIRARARIPDLGFSVGVFTKTGEAMPGYSDVNTNGIILGAIAHILRKPA